ncbi:MAG: hypothetical protein HRT52_20800 [Colwellia sp.]|nr:hypothetical protein [Colwellia sp.]
MALNTNRFVNLFILFGHIQYLVLTTIAMFFYPGGHMFDHLAVGYSFRYNFFSDLGHALSFSGVDNTISSTLNTIALPIIGLAQLVFYIREYINWRKPTALRICTLIFGGISSIGVLLIAYFPNDVEHQLHMMAVYFWLLGFLGCAIIYIYFNLSGTVKSYKSFAFTIPLLVLIASQLIQSHYQWIDLMPLTQKLLVYYMVFWFVFFTFRSESLTLHH